MKNSKWAVAKLTRDRKEALIELEKVKAELKVRDGDVKVVVEAKDKAVADLQHLVGQIGEPRQLQYRSSERLKLSMTSTCAISFLVLKPLGSKLLNAFLTWISSSLNLMTMKTR